MRKMKTKKKKDLHSDLARFSAQIFCPNCNGVAMARFCVLFLGIHTLLVTQGGGIAQRPL